MDTLHRRAVLKLPPLPAAALPLPIPPTPENEAANEALLAYVAAHCPPVDGTMAAKQKTALAALHALFAAWSQQPFHMFVSGSYRLGVHSNDADIDVLFVTTAATSRAAVFTGFLSALGTCDQATDIQPIPNARVPIIGVTLHGQEFDILTCHLREAVLPAREELLTSYEWMNGLEDACILGFNGPRLTELILQSVPRPTQFSTALRLLRHWAKCRLVYSNKAGFLGGVNFALMLMYVAQRHPKALAHTLVTVFFATFSAWKWSRTRPRPLRLDEHVQHECPVWLQAYEWAPRGSEAMVVLTPCFPRFNTTFTASQLTLGILQQEFQRAAAAATTAASTNWADLCSGVEALTTCPRFIHIAIQAPGTAEGRAWQGYVEAQCRYLVEYMSREELAIAEFRYVPVWHTAANPVTGMCTKSTYVTAADDGKIRTYLIRGTLEQPLAYFVKEHASKGPPRPTFSSISARFCAREALPPQFLPAASHVYSTYTTGAGAALLQPLAQKRKQSGGQSPFEPPVLRRRAAVPMARMHWRLAGGNEGVAPPPPVVRPLLRDGVSVRPYDVYIGHACTWARMQLPESPFAPPAAPSLPFADYAARRYKLDKQWARGVRQLRGKVLGCWCGGGAACHGHVLHALAQRSAL